MKRILLVTLVLALLLGLAMPAMAADENVPTIQCGQKKTVWETDETVEFQFIPDETGWYWFYSSGVSCKMVEGCICNWQGVIMSQNMAGENDTDLNFYTAAYLTAGNTYCLYTDAECTYAVSVTKASKAVTGMTLTDLYGRQRQSIYSYEGYGVPVYLQIQPKFADPGQLKFSGNSSVAYMEQDDYNENYHLNLETVGSTVITVTAENGVSTRLPVTAVPHPSGDDLIAAGNGSYDYHVVWEMRDNGLMIIEGEGTINDWSPWSYSVKSTVTQIALPDTPCSIGGWVFDGATSVTGITIPASVEYMGDAPFTNTGIKTICFLGSAPEMDDWALGNIEATVYYPEGDPSWTKVIRNCHRTGITWKSYPADEKGTLIKEDGSWNYYVGDVHLPVSTLVKHYGSWYYVQNGVLASEFTGFVPFNGSRYFVKDGKVVTTTGLIKHRGVWYYLNNGKLARNTTTLIKHAGQWYRVKNGVLASETTSLVKFNGEWFYVNNGKVASQHTGFVKYNNEWFYVKNGKVASKTTGLVKYNDEWFYVQNGKLARNTTTLVKHNGGWYYIKNGEVDFQSTTLVKFCGGWYYVRNGKVDFSYTGTYYFNGGRYTIKAGKVA